MQALFAVLQALWPLHELIPAQCTIPAELAELMGVEEHPAAKRLAAATARLSPAALDMEDIGSSPDQCWKCSSMGSMRRAGMRVAARRAFRYNRLQALVGGIRVFLHGWQMKRTPALRCLAAHKRDLLDVAFLPGGGRSVAVRPLRRPMPSSAGSVSNGDARDGFAPPEAPLASFRSPAFADRRALAEPDPRHRLVKFHGPRHTVDASDSADLAIHPILDECSTPAAPNLDQFPSTSFFFCSLRR